MLRKQYYANPSVAAANIKSSRSVHTLHLKACIRLIPRCPQRKNDKAICNSMAFSYLRESHLHVHAFTFLHDADK